MSKVLKVNNVDPANSAKVLHLLSASGPVYHEYTLAPGESKLLPIGPTSYLKVEEITGPVAVTVENQGSNVTASERTDSSLNSGNTAPFTVGPDYLLIG